MRKKIIYVLSQIDKAIAFEWMIENLSKEKYDISFIVLNYRHGYLETYCREHGIPYTHIQLGKKWRYPFMFFKLWWYFLRIKPNIVHFHLLEASLLGLPAAWLAGIKKRIYTRHHSTYHHVYFPKAIWLDKVCNFFATDIIAISQVVRQVLVEWEHCPPRKVKLIHHGFDLQAFSRHNEEEILYLKNKYNPALQRPVIGIISRFIVLKGVAYVIQAMEKVLQVYPDALFLFFGTEGNMREKFIEMLKKYPPHSYDVISFENNITQLYKIFDVFVHVPIDPMIEAFGQTYIEALASGIPMVCTLSGVAHEFVVHKKNAWVVPYQDANAIAEGILTLVQNEHLRKQLIEAGKESVRIFALENMINKLEQLYDES